MADWRIIVCGCACYLFGLCHGWKEKGWSSKRRTDSQEPSDG